VLNLAPLITAALKDISGPLSRLTGKAITPPTISAVPVTAGRQIAALAHARLPADCGQIPLFPASALTRARLAFRLLDAGTLALVILAPMAGAAALLAGPRRRRALLWISIGGGLTALVTWIALTLLRSSLITRAQARSSGSGSRGKQPVAGHGRPWSSKAVLRSLPARPAARGGTAGTSPAAASRPRALTVRSMSSSSPGGELLAPGGDGGSAAVSYQAFQQADDAAGAAWHAGGAGLQPAVPSRGCPRRSAPA
jgi:hypothetical protein